MEDKGLSKDVWNAISRRKRLKTHKYLRSILSLSAESLHDQPTWTAMGNINVFKSQYECSVF